MLTVVPNDAEALAGAGEGRPAPRAGLPRLRSVHVPDCVPRTRATPRCNVSGQGRRRRYPRLIYTKPPGWRRLATREGLWQFFAAFMAERRPPGDSGAGVLRRGMVDTAEGRPQAIAGLRALCDRFPEDSRYAIALGKLLLGSPRTRAEGRGPCWSATRVMRVQSRRFAERRRGQEQAAGTAPRSSPLAMPAAPVEPRSRGEPSAPKENRKPRPPAAGTVRTVSAQTGPGRRPRLRRRRTSRIFGFESTPGRRGGGRSFAESWPKMQQMHAPWRGWVTCGSRAGTSRVV